MLTTGNCDQVSQKRNRVFASCQRKQAVLTPVGKLPGTWHPIAR